MDEPHEIAAYRQRWRKAAWARPAATRPDGLTLVYQRCHPVAFRPVQPGDHHPAPAVCGRRYDSSTFSGQAEMLAWNQIDESVVAA